jgi:hypothetical protein
VNSTAVTTPPTATSLHLRLRSGRGLIDSRKEERCEHYGQDAINMRMDPELKLLPRRQRPMNDARSRA